MKRKLPPPRDESDRKVLNDVSAVGCDVVGVLAHAHGPAFSYSIGLFHQYQHPEILIVGLGHSLMHALINGVRDEIQAGARFVPGVRCPGIIADFDCEFRTVHPARYPELVGYARWFYRGDDFPLIQCVWPDRQGRFPWDPDVDPGFVSQEPIFDGRR
jgi:hypothetical protein